MHNAAAEGPVVTVSGHAHGTQAIVPITSNDLFAPAKQYHAYVAAGLNTLVSQTDAPGLRIFIVHHFEHFERRQLVDMLGCRITRLGKKLRERGLVRGSHLFSS